jgi:hypothetical protein
MNHDKVLHMALQDKENFDALMRLCDFRFARWQNRRGIEWKMSYAFWATLVAAAATCLKLPDLRIPLWAAGVPIIAVAVHVLWLKTNWISNQMDILTAFHFAEHAEKIARPDSPVVPKARLEPGDFRRKFRSKQGWFEFLRAGACQAPLCTTVFLALVLLLILAVHK